MIFPFIENLSHGSLIALSLGLFITLSLLILTLVFRSLNPVEVKTKQKSSTGRFGFDKSSGIKISMEVLGIVNLTPSTKLFRLKPETYFDYDPGQFLTFYLGEDGKLPRNYSLNTSPTRPGIYEVSVKLLENGKGSTWMHQKIQVGDKLTVGTPSGRFFLRQVADEYIFVACGIGITPMFSMVQYCVDKGVKKPIYFFYACRYVEELAFHNELQFLANKTPNLRYFPIISCPSESWKGSKGRITKEFLIKAGVNFQDSELYTCGPRPMMDMLRDVSIGEGMKESNFHYEVFTSPTNVKIEKRKAQVIVDGDILEYHSNKPLLDFLEEKGISMSSSCRAGVCGTCEIKVKKGEVFSLESEYLTSEDLAEGKRLSCICFPKTDIDISLS